MATAAHLRDSWIRWGVFALALLPLGRLIWLGAAGDLGADPIKRVELDLGLWALRFLLIGLAITPLRNLTGWSWPARRRRMIGLFAFFYLALHFVAYIVDQWFDWPAILVDLTKRPFIIVGAVAFLMLIPLAVTSTKAMMKRLGGVAWKRLHRLVYPATALAALHFAMSVKADLREPLIYAVITVILLAARLGLGRRFGAAVPLFARGGGRTR